MFHPAGSWLALVIGNSRLHWAWFVDVDLKQTWDTAHGSEAAIAPFLDSGLDFSRYPQFAPAIPLPIDPHPQLWIASVVPPQAECWTRYDNADSLTLTHIPLGNLYPTLGVDRALALWGAVKTLGAPVLVVDAGTAMTFTGADGQGALVGGAILPGLQLQMRSLSQNTAALPSLTFPSTALDLPRWATNTPDAIRSGVLYTAVAGVQSFIEAWWQQFPEGAIAFTGGDAPLLHRCLDQALAQRVHLDPALAFRGMPFLQGVTVPE